MLIRPIEILLVEDNSADARLVIEVFKDFKINNEIYHAKDGVEAIDFLYKNGKYNNMPKPDIILLDLNLPKKDGREVLKEIKKDHELKSIPVVILTTSNSEEDVKKTYSDHANCYITKPVDFEPFVNVLKSIEKFWLNMVKLP